MWTIYGIKYENFIVNLFISRVNLHTYISSIFLKKATFSLNICMQLESPRAGSDLVIPIENCHLTKPPQTRIHCITRLS